ncbi:hypothetical protein HZS61_001660 [Fusarium oxysporum f. sp. conglutinans]|uniref:DUF7791 domain-containing protein n=1 Tax=Fusarium oxysporum f. sp. conglutinans TaxID=100902 RepID=A0A8H6H543_FUSOX|nr:hypothetical protein HZS61_001660 [Fusarium oxysporum f. sp. conglutinans]
MATGLEALGAASAVVQLIAFAGSLASLSLKIYDGMPTPENELEEYSTKMMEAARRVQSRGNQVPQGTQGTQVGDKLSKVSQECIDAATELKRETQMLTKRYRKGKMFKAVYSALRAESHKTKLNQLNESLKRCKEVMETELLLRICDQDTAIAQQQTQGFRSLEIDVQILILKIAEGHTRVEQLVSIEARATRDAINTHVTSEFKALGIKNISDNQLKRLGSIGVQNLRLDDLTKPEMVVYLRKEFERLPKDQSADLSLEEVTNTLLAKARGVFLWLSLATRSVINGITNGDDQEILSQRLEELPEELESLYQKMWERLNGNDRVYRETAARYFRFVIADGWATALYNKDGSYAYMREPNLIQLSLAINVEDSFIFPPKANAKKLFELTALCAATESDVQTRCAGMLQVARHSVLEERRAEFPDAMYPLTRLVHFIHRTAHDFLVDTEAGQSIVNYKSNEITLNIPTESNNRMHELAASFTKPHARVRHIVRREGEAGHVHRYQDVQVHCYRVLDQEPFLDIIDSFGYSKTFFQVVVAFERVLDTMDGPTDGPTLSESSSLLESLEKVSIGDEMDILIQEGVGLYREEKLSID